MHLQGRARPIKSPPDLEAFVAVLSAPETPPGEPTRVPINIEGVSGGAVELGGEFVFAVEHGREEEARAWLRGEGYDAELFEVFHRELPANSPGALLEAIRGASGIALDNGQVIKDVLIGQETSTGTFFVQVAFQDVKVRPTSRPG